MAASGEFVAGQTADRKTGCPMGNRTPLTAHLLRIVFVPAPPTLLTEPADKTKSIVYCEEG